MVSSDSDPDPDPDTDPDPTPNDGPSEDPSLSDVHGDNDDGTASVLGSDSYAEYSDPEGDPEPVAGLTAASSCVRFSLCLPEEDEESGGKDKEGGGEDGSDGDDEEGRSGRPSRTSPSSSSSSSPPGRRSLSFRPVYTHQCFGAGEFVPGCLPTAAAEEESGRICAAWRMRAGSGKRVDGAGEARCRMGRRLHRSYHRLLAAAAEGDVDVNADTKGDRESDRRRRRNRDFPRVDVHVRLSPSCEDCRIDVGVDVGVAESAGKRARVGKNVKNYESISDDGEKEAGRLRSRIGGAIVRQIDGRAVPRVVARETGRIVFSDDREREMERDDRWWRGAALEDSVGRVVEEYRRAVRAGDGGELEMDEEFAIAIADGSDPRAAEYHDRVQSLAPWFIEAADGVDIASDGGGCGYWRVAYLFRVHRARRGRSRRCYSLAGYVTLFHFRAPFRKPQPGVVLRICQALVLPPYQRAGHGSELLTAVHRYAGGDYAEKLGGLSEVDRIVEVNVEDPAPGFAALRDVSDYCRFRDLVACGGGGDGNVDDVGNDKYFAPPTERCLTAAADALRITRRQARVAREMHKLAMMTAWADRLRRGRSGGGNGGGGGGEDGSGNEGSEGDIKERICERETRYRLMVKRSLLELHGEEIDACGGGKEGRKARLAELFDERLSYYSKLLRIGLNRKHDLCGETTNIEGK